MWLLVIHPFHLSFGSIKMPDGCEQSRRRIKDTSSPYSFVDSMYEVRIRLRASRRLFPKFVKVCSSRVLCLPRRAYCMHVEYALVLTTY